MENIYWPQPKRRSVGLFTDLRLFYDVLDIGYKFKDFTKKQLKEDLSQRVKGLIYIEELSTSVINDVIRELKDFQWIEPIKRENITYFNLTKKGIEALQKFKTNKFEYIKELITKMHQIYTIPGWFVNRLWDLNPDRQGEIVIPAPLREWSPKSKLWEDKKWDNELIDQTIYSIRLISKIQSNTFLINEKIWVDEVKKAWVRLSNIPPKKKDQIKNYTPRRRLSSAMKEAAVKLLFGNTNHKTRKNDFNIRKSPLSPRIYMAWCPRLLELGLIFYTDFHPKIPGRLICPVSVFRKNINKDSLKKIETIQNPINEFLYLHQPSSKTINKFIKILYIEHQKLYSQVKSLYVSIMDVRDEVCRQLRLSVDIFDKLLEKAMKELLNSNIKYTISIETDIREDQRSGYQILRRPVIINGIPYSLIAMAQI